MREQKYYLVFDEIEKGIILRSLNELRNRLLSESRYTDAVDELLIKFANAKKKKFRIKIMVKTIFEEMGGTYTKVGDYCLPNLLSAEKGEQPIGLWGQRHSHYLKQNHRVLYMNLLTSGKLNSYLADIDEQAEDMFFRLVEQMAEREGVNKQLKADN